MLRKIFFTLSILLIINKLYSQIDTSQYLIKTDTILSIDTIIKNNTVYITKTYKIHVRLIPKKKEKVELLLKKRSIYDSLKITPIQIGFMNPGHLRDISPLLRKNEPYKIYANMYFSYGKWNIKPKFSQYLQPMNDFALVGSVEIFRKNTAVRVDVGKMFFYEKFSYNMEVPNIDTSKYMQIREYQIMHIDTIWFINLDSLVNGDTVWMPYYDTTYNTRYDTSYLYHYDTTYNVYDYNNINSYQFVPFSLGFKYRFRLKKISFDISSSLNFLFLTRVGGFYIHNTYEKVPLKRIFEFKLYSLNLNIAAEILYPLSKNIFIFWGVSTLYPITQIYNYSAWDIKFTSYNMNAGLKILLR